MNQIKQGYKQTKVGIIPEDWEVVRLGDICKFYKGKGISKENLSEEGIPCIRYGELYTTYNEKIDNVFSKTNVDIKELFLSKSNDIIIPASGETAIDIATASCVLHDNIALSGDLNVIRTKENGIFLSYYLNVVAKHRIASIAQGVSVVHLYSSQLENLFLSLPPLKEQEKIAQILTTWDEAITRQTELLEAKELQKKAIMQKLLSGEVRFDDFDDEWEEYILGNIGKTFTGLSGKTAEDFGSGDSKYITYKSIFDSSEINLTRRERVSVSINEEQNLVQFGDVFFTVSSETPEEVGMSSVLLQKVENTYLNSFCFGYRINDFNILAPKFARFYFRSFYIRDKLMRLAQGSTRFNLSKNGVLKLKVKLPSLAEQVKIAEVLSISDAELNLLKRELEELKLQKKALMQKLLTGQVRVKV